MKIFSINLEIYIPDSLQPPDNWDWDHIIHTWNSDVNILLTGCDRRKDLEDTIPTKEYSDSTEPPTSEI